MNLSWVVLKLVQLGVTLLATLSLFLLALSGWWVTDLLRHFTVQYFLCALVALFVLVVLRIFTKVRPKRYWSALTLVLVLYHGHPVMSFVADGFSLHLKSNPAAKSFRVMSLNVLSSNRQYDLISREIHDHDPDVLLLLEVQNHLLENLKEIKTRYPYRIEEPRSDNFGMALYSKFPLSNEAVYYWGEWSFPYMKAVVHKPNLPPITFYGVHPVPPVGQALALDNHAQMEHVLRVVEKDGPVIIAGDFNNTPWSHSYRVFENRGFNNANSGVIWGTWLPHLLGGLLLDHIFVRNVLMMSWARGADIGSDHRAVIAGMWVRPMDVTDEK